ncbi:DUF1624 domain-containing protein [Flavobacterium sp. 3HN19-14]|uniref:DUF1624 domain-containing protein n=1 Tax=Flavobacterium sp. 3HN19-14 TaxID=3448133 RepID=UPI003EDFEED9
MFTRWITHLCAPIFVFLAGTSCWLSMQRTGNLNETRNFLLKRGLWLIFLEFTIVNFGIWFDPGFHTILFQVIAAIGFGFVFLALMLRLSAKTIGVIGICIIMLHNLLPLLPLADDSIIKIIVTPFFGPAVYPIGSSVLLLIYGPIPWLGILLVGFAAGKLFTIPTPQRINQFLKLGFGLLLLFTVVRYINIYGDPALWSPQKNTLFTFLSFMNVSKYAPSLLYCAVTLGFMFLILAFAEKTQNRFTRILSVYGEVPMFYYLIHWYVIHLVMVGLMFGQGFHWEQLDFVSGRFGRPKDVQSGVGLLWIYIIWIVIIISMYFPSKWFANYKRTHKKWWLRYV